MRKLLILMLALLFCILSITLIACGNDEEESSESEKESSSSEVPSSSTDDSSSSSSDESSSNQDKPHTHEYGEWQTITEETCTEKGLKRKTCSCGDYVDEEIPASHKYENGKCSRCGITQPESQGLEFELNEVTDTYEIIGIGTCTDTSLVIPSTHEGKPVTSIEYKAFYGYDSLKSVTIPSSIGSIGTDAFDCEFLASVNYLGTIEQWCNISFSDFRANPLYYAKKLYLNGSLVSNLVIPSTVTKINDYAFYLCNSITSITIPSSVKRIGNRAFYGCHKLVEVYNLSSLDVSFSSAKAIHSALDEPSILDTTSDGYVFAKISDSEIYLVDYVGNDTELILPKSYKDNNYSINDHAFYHLVDITKVTIPNSVTSIGEYAFSWCTSLTGITIPNSVTSIGDWAFYHCTSLTSATIGPNVTSIRYNAFESCPKLVEVYNLSSLDITICVNEYAKVIHTSLDESSILETVNDYTFMTWEGKYYLVGYVGDSTELTFPKNYKNDNYEIYKYAFGRCDDITKVTIPNSITSIGDWAFSSCYTLKSVNISDIASWCNISFYDYGANPLNYAHNLYLNGTLVTDLVIPNTVTEIKDYSFYDCDSLTSITIPNSVTSIGEDAFSDCDSLTSITIPNSVTSIGDYAFRYCDSLTSITIPNSVTSIGSNAFSGCDSLANVNYLGTIEQWCNIPVDYNSNPLCNGANLYLNGILVTELVIPSTVTKIKDYAFYNCKSLTSVTIPNGVETIGNGAFSNCNSLTSIIIPDSVTEIGSSAFNSCYSLTSVTLPNGVETIGNGAFSNCNSLTSIIIPDSVTEIGTAFSYCNSLTSVTIPNSVTSIGRDAFEGCTSLTSVNISDIASWCNISFYDYGANPLNYAHNLYLNGTLVTDLVIPSTVKEIKDYAFYHCTSLTSITIPNSVTSIGGSAFSNCHKLVEVYNLSSLNITKGSNSYGYIGKYAEVIHTSLDEPSILEMTNDYIFMTWEGKYYLIGYVGNEAELTLSESYKSNNYEIYQYAFYNRDDIAKVTIPNSVTSIGSYAFSNCDSFRYNEYDNAYYLGNDTNPYLVLVKAKDNSISSCVINENTKIIYSNAFYGCDSLTTITISNNVVSIGNNAFYSCDSLTSVNISDIASWCNISFYDYDSNPLYYGNLYLNGSLVTDLVIPDTVTEIKGIAFSGCDLLTSVTIPNSVTSIGDSAFYYCDSLTSVIIGNGITSIGNAAFAACDSLTSVIIGNSITSIGDSAFYYCDSLKYNEYDNAYYLGNDTNPYVVLIEAKDKSITSCVINENTKLIHSYAFNKCNSLTSVTIPGSVTSIGNSAFSGCDSLTRVNISDIASWCNISFYDYDSNPLYYGNLYLNGSLVTDLVIPNTVTEIKDSAFHAYDSLTKVTIPSSVKKIGAHAFYHCDSLTSVTIVNGVTSIGDSAFSGCKSLTTITIPNSITLIGSSAFAYCDSLVSIEVDDENTTYKSIDGNLYSKDGKKLIQYACGKTNISFEIPSSVTSIESNAFLCCFSLTSVTIPNSVTLIGYSAFAGCDSLTSVAFGNPNGWWYSNNPNASSGTSISSDGLSKASTAAQYLRASYYNYYWKRG